MANRTAGDEIKNFVWAVIFAIVVIAIILYFIVEVLIPFLVGLFLVLLTVVLAATSIRLLVQLIAHLTLEKRARRNIATLSQEIFDIDATSSVRQQRMEGWSADDRRGSQIELQRHASKREERHTKRQRTATGLANHLANRLEKVNRSRRKLARQTAAVGNNNLSEKLGRQNGEAAVLEVRINRLRRRYYIEPDPAFDRKERMYPIISGFDRFISTLLKRGWARLTRGAA